MLSPRAERPQALILCLMLFIGMIPLSSPALSTPSSLQTTALSWAHLRTYSHAGLERIPVPHLRLRGGAEASLVKVQPD